MKSFLPKGFKPPLATCTTPLARFLHHQLPGILASEPAVDSPIKPHIGNSRPEPTGHAPKPPLTLSKQSGIRNPVLTGRDIHDFGRVTYVADPFLLPVNGNWHMFFEIYNGSRSPTAAIGHATSSDGYNWKYNRRILTTDTHLSFPYVFTWDGDFFLVPDQMQPVSESNITIYRATNFPENWTPVTTIISPPRRTSDHVIFRWNDHWWCLVGHEQTGSLYCYHSPELLTGGWIEHNKNPVISNRSKAARPGGRPIVTDEGIIMFYQDCANSYGERIHARMVEELTPQSFVEQSYQDIPVADGNGIIGWNSGSMHHIDPWLVNNGIFCAVDGDVALGRNSWASSQWSIGLCTL